jgi:tripartite-type tricarboxylate transporter receptor subunit TctC
MRRGAPGRQSLKSADVQFGGHPVKRLTLALALALLVAPLAAVAQTAWPSKPVRVIVAFPPGGTTDILARLVSDALSRHYGQQFVVDNRPGAAGNTGSEAAAKATPDGSTFIMMTPGPVAIHPYLYRTLPFDPEKDFAAVSWVARVANVLAVYPGFPAKDLREFIAYAKANPGKINYATPGNGSTGHLSTELFKSMTGTDLVHIPYRGSGPALNDLIAGQVQMTIDNLPSALPQIQAGKLRALGVSSEKRWFATPDIPAIAEAVPGYEASSWFGLMAPAGTPADIVQKLSAEVDRLLKTEELKKRFADIGAEPIGRTPEFFAAHIAAERTKWKRVVEVSGAKVD